MNDRRTPATPAHQHDEQPGHRPHDEQLGRHPYDRPPYEQHPHDPGRGQGLPAPRAEVVFDAPFTDRHAWAAGRTSAYPPDGRNPDDNKLDQIGPAHAPTADGVFRARRAPDGLWDADLVSTEYAPGGFELLPGDELTATCVVHDVQGAWPALWTWGRDSDSGHSQPGHGEVDAFEYHPTNPRMLELTNHVRPAASYADEVITPGRPFACVSSSVPRVCSGGSTGGWSSPTAPVSAGTGAPGSWSASACPPAASATRRPRPAPASWSGSAPL